MSSGAVKGIEVLLIAGVVFWFAYSQLNALKQSKPTDNDNDNDNDNDKAGSATEEQNTKTTEEGGSSSARSQGND